MKWPTHTDYQDSIQNPEICFFEPDLKAGTITLDPLGLPRVMSGNFASVYELTTPAGHWAIRCFVRQVAGQQDRYTKLSQYLGAVNLDCLVKFEYILKGILVQGEWYPVVKMQWVQGYQLNGYVEEHLQEPELLRQLAARWRSMVNQTRAQKLAHGDFQHGNIMVTADGQLRLVDYDGMFCPLFGRSRSPELGHANFQHPRRVPEYYEEKLDNFSALVIYASLLALAKEPDLWDKFFSGDNLILTSGDFRNTQNSEAFKRLKASPDPAVKDLANLLQQCCIAPIGCVPWFEDAVRAQEQGQLGAVITAMHEAAKGAPAPPPPEPLEQLVGAQPAPAASRAVSRPAPAFAGTRTAPAAPGLSGTRGAPAAAPVAAQAAPLPRGGNKLWLALAAAGVLVLGAGAFFLLSGGKKGPPAPPTTTPPTTAPSTPGTPPQAGTPPAPTARPVAVAPLALANALRTLTPGSGGIGWVAFSAGGRAVATGGEDGSIKIWDPGTGQPRQTLPGQGDGIHSAVFLPDAKTLATVTADNVLRYWIFGTAQAGKTVSDYGKNLWPISLAPDGLTLATGASDRKIVRLVDPTTGAQKRLLSQHASWVRSVDFSPDSKLLAVACWDDTVKLWVSATGEARQTLTVLSNTVDGVGFSPDSRLLATGGQGRTVRLWDTQSGALKQTLLGTTGDLKCYAFSPSGRLLAAGSADKTTRVWEAASGLLKATFGGHNDAVTAVAFSPDGSLLATGSADQTVKLWDVSKFNP